jgi:hypothetical protein
MFIAQMKVRCDFCGKEEQYESVDPSMFGGGPPPKDWFSYGRVLVCPECKKKHNIVDLVQLNKKVGAERKKRREQEDLETGDE